jgi:D-glycero-D-manno-heptose 1,7-bisphosphate phosphatase
MLRDIGERFNTAIAGVPAIGDSLRDLEAAAAVRALPILVLTGKGGKTLDAGGLPDGTRIYPDLAAVAADLAK